MRLVTVSDEVKAEGNPALPTSPASTTATAAGITSTPHPGGIGGIVGVGGVGGAGGTGGASHSLLQFNSLTESERSLILMEILLSNRAKPLSAEEKVHLKALPLFTPWVRNQGPGSGAQNEGRNQLWNQVQNQIQGPVQGPPVSIAECVSGVFWCNSSTVFEGIVYPSVAAEGNTFYLRFFFVFFFFLIFFVFYTLL